MTSNNVNDDLQRQSSYNDELNNEHEYYQLLG